MPEQKKEQDKSVEIEAGGLKADGGQALGNPRPRHTPTVLRSARPFTRLRQRLFVSPSIEYAAIDLVDRNVNRGPFTKGY